MRILIAGGTSGVGYAVAKHLAGGGHTIILVGRDRERGARAVETLATEGSHIRFISCDLTDVSSVRDLAARVEAEYDRLDAISYNAGVMSLKRRTVAGSELTFAVNYLGFFALNELLLPMLRRSAPSRTICVSGGPGIISRVALDFDDLDCENRYFGPVAAVRAAVAKVMYIRELAERLEGTGVVPLTYHPGIVHSNLGRDLPPLLRIPFSVMNAFFPRETETGNFVAESELVLKNPGGFYVRRGAIQCNLRHSLEDCRNLVRLSSERTGIEVYHAS